MNHQGQRGNLRRFLSCLIVAAGLLPAGCGSGVSPTGTVTGTWRVFKQAVTGSTAPTSIDDPNAGYNGIDTGGQVFERWAITSENGQLKMTITDLYGQSYGPIPGQATSDGAAFQIQYEDPRIAAYGVPSQSVTTIVVHLAATGLWGTEEIKTYVANGLGIIDYSVPSTESWIFRGVL
jgi:hypothetical protein